MATKIKEITKMYWYLLQTVAAAVVKSRSVGIPTGIIIGKSSSEINFSIKEFFLAALEKKIKLMTMSCASSGIRSQDCKLLLHQKQ